MKSESFPFGKNIPLEKRDATCSLVIYTTQAKSLNTPYELNVFYYILMTVGSTNSHLMHQNYTWNYGDADVV